MPRYLQYMVTSLFSTTLDYATSQEPVQKSMDKILEANSVQWHQAIKKTKGQLNKYFLINYQSSNVHFFKKWIKIKQILRNVT